MHRPVDRLSCEMKKGAYFDGFDETNKQTPERSCEILRKDCPILRPQKGRFSEFCLQVYEKGVRIPPITKITRKYLFSECGI